MEPAVLAVPGAPGADAAWRDELELITRIDDIRRRADECRRTLLEMIHRAGSGHIGSSLSCVDVISVLKFDQMNWHGEVPRKASDVFVLSKGHAVPAWYAALVVDGELDAEHVGSLRRLDSQLQGHPDRNRCDLVDVSTGALGQGLSLAIGRAEAKRLRGEPSFAYCILGDGECQEGQVWEAAMYAGARGVANVVAIVDYNKSQNDDALDAILPLHPLDEKFKAFGWHVQEVDGHSHLAIRDAIVSAKADQRRPSVVLAHTRKGYLGRGRILLNGAHSGALSQDQFEEAVAYLRRAAA